MDAAGDSDGNTRGRGLRSPFRRRRNEPGRQTAGASIPPAATPDPRDGSSGKSRPRAIRSFWPKEHGGTTVETAVALAVAVAAFAGLMEIVNTAFESDRMDRAARAAAQATALDPNADACAAIRRELRLPDGFDCAAWEITVHQGVLPSNLSNALRSGSPDATGDMVLVRIDWSRAVRSLANVLPAASAVEDAGGDDPDESLGSGLVSGIAIGLARSEPLG